MNSIAKKNIVVENNLILESDGHFKYESYINFLSEIGYARVSTVNHLGEFSVKGDIIDIFPSEFKENKLPSSKTNCSTPIITPTPNNSTASRVLYSVALSFSAILSPKCTPRIEPVNKIATKIKSMV